MDTRWKRRNKASFGQMAAFALVLATNPVLAFVICPNFSGAMGILLLLLSCAMASLFMKVNKYKLAAMRVITQYVVSIIFTRMLRDREDI